MMLRSTQVYDNSTVRENVPFRTIMHTTYNKIIKKQNFVLKRFDVIYYKFSSSFAGENDNCDHPAVLSLARFMWVRRWLMSLIDVQWECYRQDKSRRSPGWRCCKRDISKICWRCYRHESADDWFWVEVLQTGHCKRLVEVLQTGLCL